MIFKKIAGPKPGLATYNSTEYEPCYLAVYNNSGLAIPVGGSVCYDAAATVAQNLGFAVTRPATANLMWYAGVCPWAIPIAAWGLVQVSGIIELALGVLTSGQSQIPQNGSFILAARAAVTIGT